MQNKILLVEDSLDYQKMVRSALGFKYQLDFATSLDQAKKKVHSGDYDLMILDVLLPDGTGFDFYSEMQAELEAKQIPVIFLTGKSDISDKMMGFSLGADDYLTKPFDPPELLIRVDSRISKNQKRKHQAENLKKGPLRFEVANFSLYLNSKDAEEKRIDMTPIEFKILLRLAQNSNKVLSRQQLLDGVWGHEVYIEDRCIDKHICSIRKKINPYGNHIKTVSGVGYEFQVEQPANYL